MPLARSGGGGGGPTNAVLCNDIADRNSKPLVNKQEYLVLDAIADPNVNSHIAARYMYLNNGWVLLSKYSDLSIVYDYNALINKPSSNVSSIDNAVSKVHDHPNKAVIDADQQSFTTTLKTKLDGIETEANKYIHPVNHPATVITEDSTHRFMTDAEKTKLAGIDENANNYSHPVNHSADMITETTTKQFITEAKKTIINNLSEINNKLAYKGTVIEGGEGGTAEPYTNANPVPLTVGGIASGTTFDNVSINEVLDMLLYPYQTPTFSSFTLSGISSPLEVGATIGGSKNFLWGTTNPNNITPNSLSLYDVSNGNTLLAANLINDGDATVISSTVSKATSSNHTFRIVGQNTKNQSFQRDLTISWVWRRYFGESVSSSLTETNIKSLRVNNLASSITGNYSFNTGGYKYIVVSELLPLLTTFKDQSTNLDVPMESPVIVSITNVNGIAQNYRVHRTTNIINGSITIVAS